MGVDAVPINKNVNIIIFLVDFSVFWVYGVNPCFLLLVNLKAVRVLIFYTIEFSFTNPPFKITAITGDH